MPCQIRLISGNNARGFPFVLSIAKWRAQDDEQLAANLLSQPTNEK